MHVNAKSVQSTWWFGTDTIHISQTSPCKWVKSVSLPFSDLFQWKVHKNIFVLLIQLCTQHFHVSHVFSVRYKCREILGENMQRRSAEVEFNQRKGDALVHRTVHRTSFNWPIQQTLYKPVFAYWDTQVCDKRNLLAQIMLGFYVILCKNHSKPWSLSKYPFTKLKSLR